MFVLFKSQKERVGFTLVELLITIGIIGILATVTVVSIGSARAKARDAKRLSEVKAIQTALTIYQNEKQYFPNSGGATLLLGTTQGSYGVLCDTDAGFQTNKDACKVYFMEHVPGDPMSKPGSVYEYKYTDSPDYQTYTIDFRLESDQGQLKAGDHKATPAGVQ